MRPTPRESSVSGRQESRVGLAAGLLMIVLLARGFASAVRDPDVVAPTRCRAAPPSAEPPLRRAALRARRESVRSDRRRAADRGPGKAARSAHAVRARVEESGARAAPAWSGSVRTT